MTVKKFHLSDGRTIRLGRRTPVVHFPTLKLARYMAVPTPPETVSYSDKAASALRNMYKNDVLGDCVIACMEHLEGVFTGNAGESPVTYTDEQTVATYSGACGYDPTNSATDQGCDVQTVLGWWHNNGIAKGSSHKIAGWLAVNPSNIIECQTALWLFENLVFGVGLPNEWLNPVPESPGFIWDVAGDSVPENGHCFPAVGYDSKGFKICTWGMLGTMTDAAISKYAASPIGGELYTIISQEILDRATEKSPAGVNWTSLVNDFQMLGGKLKLDENI